MCVFQTILEQSWGKSITGSRDDRVKHRHPAGASVLELSESLYCCVIRFLARLLMFCLFSPNTLVLNKDISTCRTMTITGTLKRPSLQDEEKLKLNHQKGSSNFNSLPANVSKMHLQGSPHYLGAINLNDFSNHTLTLKKDKSQPPKSIYICDGDIFKKLDTELSRAQDQAIDTSYVILPANTSTLRPKPPPPPPKDDTKYSINIDQMPQTRLIHLSMATDPGFVVKSPPREPVVMGCGETQASPMLQQQQHQQLSPPVVNKSGDSLMPNSLLDTGESGNSGTVSKSETISTLSMSSLEVSGMHGIWNDP